LKLSGKNLVPKIPRKPPKFIERASPDGELKILSWQKVSTGKLAACQNLHALALFSVK
jgi:hypothetical protein